MTDNESFRDKVEGAAWSIAFKVAEVIVTVVMTIVELLSSFGKTVRSEETEVRPLEPLIPNDEHNPKIKHSSEG